MSHEDKKTRCYIQIRHYKYINSKTGLIEIPSFEKNPTHKEFLQYLIDNNPSMECIEEVISKEGEREKEIINSLQCLILIISIKLI